MNTFVTFWLLLAVVGGEPPETFQFGYEDKAACEEMRTWLSTRWPMFPFPCVAYVVERRAIQPVTP